MNITYGLYINGWPEYLRVLGLYVWTSSYVGTVTYSSTIIAIFN